MEPTHLSENGTEDTPLSILCVDDETSVLADLRRVFRKEDFNTITATSGMEALDILKVTPNVGMIISDYRMPEMNGIDFLNAAARIAPDANRMILTGFADFQSSTKTINGAGSFCFMNKPWDDNELLRTVRDGVVRYLLSKENQYLTESIKAQNIELLEWNNNLKKRVLHQTSLIGRQSGYRAEQDADTCDAFASFFVDVIQQRNPRIAKHLRLVALLAENIAKNLKMDILSVREIKTAALLYDVGLICAPDRLLPVKTKLLSKSELSETLIHRESMLKSLDRIPALKRIKTIISCTQEMYDGSGYPNGVSGDKIPIGSQIIALSNWISTAAANEPSHNAKYEISKKLDREMGKLFNPSLSSAAKQSITHVLIDPPLPIKSIAIEEVAIADIQIGMVLADNLNNKKGAILYPKGTTLDEIAINKLWGYFGNNDIETGIAVLEPSITIQKMPLSKLSEGMVLTTDVFDVQGNILAMNGNRLTRKTIETLRRSRGKLPTCTVFSVRKQHQQLY